ncbi:Pre-mRNA-splicing factor cwc26 [Saitoella coloradoensis]
MSSLAEYLAKNYLTKDEPARKKRKRKATETQVVVKEDNATGWENVDNEGKEEEDAPAIAESELRLGSGGFKKAPLLQVAPGSQSSLPQPSIFSSEPRDGLRMADGTLAGLQTAAQIKAQIAARRAEEEARFLSTDAVQTGKGTDTVYRDATGRRVDIALQRAEARKRTEEEEERKKNELEMNQGLVQQREREMRRRELEAMKAAPLARRADDSEINEELKKRERWNDPAAAFLKSTRKTEAAAGSKPVYQGGFPPNRYGIRPGYRWDGVDRSNGFEKQWFTRQNERAVKEAQYHSWATEDM